MRSPRDIYRTIRAYVMKDLKISFRFRLSLFNTLFAPVLTMFSFMLTYSAIFFGAGSDADLGFVNQGNYVIYLLTGFLTYSVFRMAWGSTELRGEVGSYTLYGMLMAPSSRINILAGKAVRAFVEILLSTIIFSLLIVLLRPTVNVKGLVIGSIAIFFLFVVFISIDFMVTAIGLVNPGLSGIITGYVPKAFLLIGCIYFPVDVIPEWARWMVYLNPLYHAVNLFRNGFMDADLRWGMQGPFIYITVLAFVLPLLSLFVFEAILKKWHIRGF